MKPSAVALSPFGLKTVGPTIHDLPPLARDFLQQHGTVRSWAAGEEVQRHRAPVTQATWILEGRLRTQVLQPDGTEQLNGWMMQDEIFGVSNLLADFPSRVTALADSPRVRTLHFSRDVLLDLFEQVPGAGVGIAVGLSRRTMQLFDIIDVGGPRTTADKLRAVLVWWAKHYGIPGRDGSVELWVAQKDLANAVGASRQRVHLELQALRDLGELDLAYRKLIIRPLFFERMKQASG